MRSPDAATPSTARANDAYALRRRMESRMLWAAAGLFALNALLTIFLTDHARRQQEWVRHTLEVRNATQALLSQVQDAENAQRGFLLTGDNDYLERGLYARASVPNTLRTLAELAIDNPTQAARVAALKPLIERRLGVIENVITLYRSGKPEAALARVRDGQGRRMMDQIRLDIGQIDRQERRLLDQRRKEADAALTLSASAILLTLLAATALVALSVRARGRALRELQSANALLEDRVLERTATLEARTRRVETLIQDMSHRVGNALSLVTGFLDLQARASRSEEVKAALAAARQRVFSIASAQRRMRIAMDSDSVEVESYFGSIVDDFRANLPDDRIHVSQTFTPETLPSEDAAAFGVILNEWLANAAKHAFGAGEPGAITVAFGRRDGARVLSVCDDGYGVPAEDAAGGLGRILVESLATSLRARIENERAREDPHRPGACWRLIVARP